MNNFSKARYYMVKQQVNPWGVYDSLLLELMAELPRECFVPEHLRGVAYSDMQIPIGHGQTMLPPKIIGRLLQACHISPQDSVLEIGTGTGYMTALLCSLAKRVHSIEIYSDLLSFAQKNLEQFAHATSLSLTLGDASGGAPHQSPYDVIIATGAYYQLPTRLKTQLAIGGRLIAFVGLAPAMQVQLITRENEDTFSVESLFETQVPYLVNIHHPEGFSF